MSDATSPLLSDLDQLLAAGGEGAHGNALDRVLKHFDCPLGTLHRLDPATQLLELCCARNLPEVVRDKVVSIPIGKGMAGIAAERREAVQVCNLQTDTSGVARPGARDTKMEGSIACPILVDGELLGVLGIAKPVPYDFTDAEVALLGAASERIGRHFRR